MEFWKKYAIYATSKKVMNNDERQKKVATLGRGIGESLKFEF